MNCPEINDFDDYELISKLSEQAIARLREYLTSEEDVENVARNQSRVLVALIRGQMSLRARDVDTDYKTTVSRGFQTLRPNYCTISNDEKPRNYLLTLPEGERKNIASMIFNGFNKCLYLMQKFDSYSELEFSRILEKDAPVVKWFKPGRKIFQIYYRFASEERQYEPDFVIETEKEKLIVEIKRLSQIEDKEVLAKANSAVQWCHCASENDAKQWRYLLIPHDELKPNVTLDYLVNQYERV